MKHDNAWGQKFMVVKDIWAQVRDPFKDNHFTAIGCVEITDHTSLNVDKGSMGLAIDMFIDNALHEKALGKLTAAEKKEKWRQAGMLRKDGGARLSAGLVVITDGYAIGPDCLAWECHTQLEKDQKAREKQRTGLG
jgi:hypothetical protein